MRPQSLSVKTVIELKIAIALLLFTFVVNEEHIRIRYTFPGNCTFLNKVFFKVLCIFFVDPNIWKINVRQSPRSARQQTGNFEVNSSANTY